MKRYGDRQTWVRAAYFPKVDEEGRLADGSYSLYSISAFDHWLTEEEFLSQPYLHFEEANRKGMLRDYLVVERSFIALFEAMSAEGVLRDGEKGVQFFARDDDRLGNFFKGIARERARAHVHFIGPEITLWPGWDLTHHLLVRSDAADERLGRIARRHGLHLLPSRQ